jgi:hypothetical protein
MTLADELARVAAAAAAFADDGEQVAGVIAAEPVGGGRLYVCSFERGADRRWLVLDAECDPVRSRPLVREAVSIAAMCEIAEDSAAGGDLAELRSTLVAVRMTEAPEGIDDAEAAALELERTIAPPPRVASASYLDRLGDAARKLELALGSIDRSPFAVAMQSAVGPVEELAADVEASYKLDLA